MPTIPLMPYGPTSFPAVERARAMYDAAAAAGHVEAVGRDGTVLRAIDGAPARQLEDAVGGALRYASDTNRLQPMTNRHISGVLDMLRGNTRLRTGSDRTLAADERRTGIRLSGEDSVPINYALLHIRPEVELAETLEKVPDMGQLSYGPIGIVLKTDVLKRSTAAEADSIDVSRVYPPEGIIDAVAGALIRRATGDEPQLSHKVGRAVNRSLEPILTNQPTAQDISIALAQAPMTAFDMRGLPPVPELQVYGGIGPSDIAAFRVQDDAPAAALAALRSAAGPYGIPIERGGAMNALGRFGWLENMHDNGTKIPGDLQEIATTGVGWTEAAKLWRDAVTRP
ncbi:MAG: hypothetical protein H7287_02980 [Thermoleophilia bacterium]|nr:hypothetical protein [Thermoleophilia bacterium]